VTESLPKTCAKCCIYDSSSAAAKLIPQNLTLPPAVPFSKTAIAKNMTEAIRLTRHIPLTRMSPMAHFMASRGSTAWEAAVKAKPDVVPDDLPAGWRILEKKPEVPAGVNLDGSKGKKMGGLLSFWGRKPASPPPDHKQEQSPAPLSEVPGSKKTLPEPIRTNTETPKLLSLSLPNQPVASLSSLPVQNTDFPSSSAPTISVIEAAVSHPETNPEPSGQPSVVSRFLSRFSRTKGGLSNGTEPRNLDLSPEDLEFLSDIVPSSAEIIQKPDPQLSDLSSMISSSSLPTRLPPPLAPPPKSPQPQSSTGNGDLLRADNGLDSLFDLSHPLSAKVEVPLPAPIPAFSSMRSNSSSAIPNSVNSIVTGVGSMTLSGGIEHPPLLQPLRASPRPTGSPLAAKFPQVMMSKSSVPGSSSTNTHSTFKLPPPPSSRSQTPLLPAPATAKPLLHPLKPTSRTSTPSVPSTNIAPVPAAAPLPLKLNDIDDFSGFHSSPPSSAANLSLQDLSFSSSQSLFPHSTSANDSLNFDDFDDFVSSPGLRTPSPPRPPSKSATAASKRLPATPAPPHGQGKVPQHHRRPSRADHSRTLSLVETAAARPGRWPAPPSPLPQPLPPPAAAPAIDPFELDLLGGQLDTGITMSMSSPATVSRHPNLGGAPNGLDSLSRHPTLLAPPVGLTPTLPPLWPPLTNQVSRPPVPAAMPPTTQSGKGGLSAQDLSFFEGF
jgi:hypothetical protein